MPDDATTLERRVCIEVLKIPLEHYPPDYFTILGISSAVDDAAAVESAAKQQAERLRRETPKELIPAARYVLKRIEKARICLSDMSSRKAYLESIGKGQLSSSDRPRPRPKSVASSKTSAGNSSAASIAKTPPPVAARPHSERSKTSSANETSTVDALDLSSLFTELAEEEVASDLIGLTDVPYKARKANKSQAVVYGSVAVVSAVVFAIIGLVAFLTGTDPAATQLRNPNQNVSMPADDKAASSQPAVIDKPIETSQNVAPSALASGSIEPKPSYVETDLQDSDRADPSAALMESPSATLPSDSDASNISSSPAVEVAVTAPDSKEPQPGQPEVQSSSHKELVTEIDLPPLRVEQSAAAAEETESVADLGYLDENAAGSLRISVDEPYLKQHAYASFYARRPDEAVAVWEIRLKAEPTIAPPLDAEAKGKDAAERSQLDGSAEGFDEVIASLQLDSSGLKFRWSQTKRATLVEQLRNCALVLTSDSLSHRIQLRPQLLTYKFMFDLSKSNHIFEVSEEHLPQADAIRFEISNVQLPGLAFELEPANGIIGKGDTLRIKTLDGGIPVEFQFVLSVTASKATVKFVPRHQLGRRWYPFTGGQVHGAIDDLQRALTDGRDRFRAAQSAMSSLPGQLSSIESRLRADSPDYARIQSQRTSLMRQLNSARGTARRLSKSIPEMESKLPQLNSLVALGKRIHMQGRLDFRAYVPLGEGELVLLKTGTEEPPSKEEEAKE